MTKKHAVGNGVDCPPKASATRVDAPEQTPKDDRAASFVGMECEDERNNSRSHAETLSATEIMLSQLMKRMQCLCDTVKDMGARMDGGFVEESQKRQQENLLLKTEIQQETLSLITEMCTRMDEGLKKSGRTPSKWYRRI